MSCCSKITMEDTLLPNDPEPQLRIVLVGRTGAGKTRSVNTILSGKKDDFGSTSKSEMKTGNIDGQNVVVVDTPGLFNPNIDQEEVVKEIKKSISLAAPGPHVFLIVLQVEKVTDEVLQMVDIIRSTFGKNTMAYTMFLFTFGSRLEDSTPSAIEKFIKSDAKLHNLIIQCHWKYHVFDNNDESPSQVTELLKKIDRMIETSKRSHYTADMLEEAEEDLKKQQQQQQQAQNPKGEETKRGPLHTSAWLGTGMGCLMGYLVGGGELTSTIGAAVGALAGAILGSVSTGLVILARKHRCNCKCKK